jgi:hypothetical protein
MDPAFMFDCVAFISLPRCSLQRILLQDRWFAHVLPLTSGYRQRAGEKYATVAAKIGIFRTAGGTN